MPVDVGPHRNRIPMQKGVEFNDPVGIVPFQDAMILSPGECSARSPVIQTARPCNALLSGSTLRIWQQAFRLSTDS